MTVYDLIRDFWAALSAVFAFLLWMVRLESKALGNEREIRRLWTQRKEDLEAAASARKDTNDMLGEIRSDVKQILSRDNQR
ncbi:hypothetical protein JQX09_25185 [Sulfitobacter pseudonitzschiae]|uniref:Uncharacterized protein n=1 Tax=Pseudosulfitobacter pseudonitzschiae TaxID=1402135 RepID=A0A9Q2S323_9RHOB|nr:hypothetical protein [Pseudosulfitobacter pseudonitzschiae]MBM2295186.1 hypothetical protein [Pseudosulfitobacter pseudonitzschiae]MBM2300097.1 hypothetical protein [Pseudosulfitobacter pseudonitzschiae]MBM2305018.1 hypothetical protein [Pseudosulfitobacter pseudonitzschiae]MBM2314795.1 hypothetical protein [Pseudosulfitobacter pseudonitzschiae]MBM2319716.1 hypothetical protein [Pseudosulfitobacter pseudonitzschiae]